MRSETKSLIFLLIECLLKGIAEALSSHRQTTTGSFTQTDTQSSTYTPPLDAQNAPQSPFNTTQG